MSDLWAEGLFVHTENLAPWLDLQLSMAPAPCISEGGKCFSPPIPRGGWPRPLPDTHAHVHTHVPSPAPKPPRARCPALLEASWERGSPSTQKQVSVTTQTCWGANTPSHAPRLTWKPLSAAGFQQKIISLMKTEKLKGNPEVILRPGFKANPLVVVGFGFSAQPGCKEEPRGSY